MNRLGRVIHSNTILNRQNNSGKTNTGNKTAFSDVLQEKLSISKHAESRINRRGINLSAADQTKLNEALNIARKKGVKETVVFYNNTAFIVNTKTSTLITAMNTNQMKGNVFTNIDSAIFL